MQKKINWNRNSLNNQIITASHVSFCRHFDDEWIINYECPKNHSKPPKLVRQSLFK